MAITPPDRLPQFITDGGIETHIIFNIGVELPHNERTRMKALINSNSDS